MKVLIIIPAYNEEENIGNVLRDLEQEEYGFDVLVINDASTDGTLTILREKGVNYLDLPSNLGIGGGVQAGYKYAHENGYDIAIQMDGDGQHVASELKKLIKSIEDGADVVIGSRFITREGFQSSRMRRFGINLLSTWINICCNRRVHDCTSGFRGVNKKYIKIFAESYAQDYPEPESIVKVGKTGGSICEVPVLMRERLGGKSSISPLKSIYYMIKVSIAILIQAISD